MAKIKRMAEFYIGQRVVASANRERRSGNRIRNAAGVVVGIEDLSYCIRQDNPYGTRNFSLRVKIDGRNNQMHGENGAYWRPEDPDARPPIEVEVDSPRAARQKIQGPTPLDREQARQRRAIVVPLVVAAVEKAGGMPSDLGAILGIGAALVQKWRVGLLYALPDDAMLGRIRTYLAEAAQPVQVVEAAPMKEPEEEQKPVPDPDQIKKRLQQRIEWWKNHGR